MSSQNLSLPHYSEFYQNFNRQDFDKHFVGDFSGQINPAIECCDRYAHTDKIALYWEGLDGQSEEVSFKKLKEETAKVANFLVAQGVKPGDFVAGLLPRTPQLLYTIIGAWKAGAIYQPLFTAFGPKAIEQRLQTSKAKVIITDHINRPKLEEVKFPRTDGVKVVLSRDENAQKYEGDFDYAKDISQQSSEFEPVARSGEDLMMMLSTSGTTGLPKGVPVPIHALTSFKIYMDYAVDLREEDRFWNLADPGWAYGLYYSVTGPLINGHSLLFNEAGFTAEDTYRVIKKYKITNLAGSPTAFRLLIGAGEELAREIKGQLRRVSSAGEALNPEVIRWFREELGTVICDHYGQTELGMVVNNHHSLDHTKKAGSMGFPMPGYKMAVVDENGQEVAPNTPGELAVDIANSSVLWFKGYYQKETDSIRKGYYHTHDTAEMNEEGLFTYVGRSDDVITSSGYRIGPFDVESALVEHPAVVESAVVGIPDEERTEIVKAYIVLNPKTLKEIGTMEEEQQKKFKEDLKEEISLFVKKSLAAHAYPRIIEFLDQLPKTPSGKIQRYLLRSK